MINLVTDTAREAIFFLDRFIADAVFIGIVFFPIIDFVQVVWFLVLVGVSVHDFSLFI